VTGSSWHTLHRKDVFVVKSDDGGRTFGDPLNVSRTQIDSPAANANSPSIAVSGDRVYVAWTISNYSWSQIYLARSSDGGATFESPDNISKSNMQSMYQQIAASGDNVYLIWNDVDSDNINHISFARSNDGGNTFRAVSNLSNNTRPYGSYEPQISADGKIAYVAWRNERQGGSDVIFGRSVDGGDTFSSTNLGDGFHPRLAVAGNNVYVSWLLREIHNNTLLNNVQFVRS
jgi:hypothetical protein